MGDVAGQGRERAFGRAISGDERLAAMGRHRLDVDDGARDAVALHDPHGFLDQEKRRADIDRENVVEAFFRCVEDVAAVGDPGGVDQHVDPAERLICGGDHRAGIGDVAQIGADEDGTGSGMDLADVERDGVAFCLVTPAQHEAGGAVVGIGPRDRLAETLGAAGDDGDLSGQCIGHVALSRGCFC